MAHDALGTHARDELGITEMMTARPIQAALASASSFAGGALLPLWDGLAGASGRMIWRVSIASLVFLCALGALAARAGGASMPAGALRMGFWGALAMAITAGVGSLFGINA
jgi:VIT1/CCC1 family predicted Fe2+/Mn2+ transporter